MDSLKTANHRNTHVSGNKPSPTGFSHKVSNSTSSNFSHPITSGDLSSLKISRNEAKDVKPSPTASQKSHQGLIIPTDLLNMNKKQIKPTRKLLQSKTLISPNDLFGIESSKKHSKPETKNIANRKSLINPSDLNILSSSKTKLKNVKTEMPSKTPIISPLDLSDLSVHKKKSSKPSFICSSDLKNLKLSQKTSSKQSKKKTSIITSSDLHNLGDKRNKPSRLTIPARLSLIEPDDLKDLDMSKEKTESFISHHPKSHGLSDDFKNSKDLVNDIRRCFSELRDEAENCLSSSRLNMRSYTSRHRTEIESRESHESDSKDSFTTKTPQSADLFESSPLARGGDMVEMRLKIEMLMNKMNRSESEAKEHEQENQKLHKIIQSLEHKIDDYKMYHDSKNVSCSGNCSLF